MLDNLRFASGAALIAAAIVLAANLPTPTRAQEAASIKATMSAQAKKLLDENGMTLEGGVLRKRGATDGTDLAIGSSAVHAIVHPKDRASLAVANYRHGKLEAVVTVGFSGEGTIISPFDEPEGVIAKLFPEIVDDAYGPAPAADAPPQGRSCADIKAAAQISELAGSDFVSSPCDAGSGVRFDDAVCDPRKVWGSLRRLYIRRLTSVPGDEVGRDAAEFLRTSSVTLKAIDVGLKMGPGVLAVYVPQAGRVELPIELFKPLWPLLKGSELPPEAAKIVEATASSLVHELRHARQAHTLGFTDPGFFETEALAYADQALFIWARLEREPDHAGMEEFDRVLMSMAGLPATPSPWWKQPLKLSDLPRLKELRGAAKSLVGKSLRENTVNDWFFARSLAGGLDGLEANVRWLEPGRTTSAFDLPADFFKEHAVAAKKSLEKLADCRDREKEPADRKRFEMIIKDREEDLRFHEDPAQHERLAKYYKAERARQQEQLDRRLTR